ncbi:MAG: hypothetical protein R3E12_03090 [Candidatus Eisenbacteria bacterium]|uniref:Uncharacterized protein n=1 Tax=Eiseniibacteriota bacterium TaxID=2212470 RepID=A0A956LXD3_UNCEI|nr:hypothetical protein [Candidatus Eisenbacteria bacterium]
MDLRSVGSPNTAASLLELYEDEATLRQNENTARLSIGPCFQTWTALRCVRGRGWKPCTLRQGVDTIVPRQNATQAIQKSLSILPG